MFAVPDWQSNDPSEWGSLYRAHADSFAILGISVDADINEVTPINSDWSDSQSEDKESSQAATAPSSAVADPGPTFKPQFIANGYKEWLQTAPPAVRAALG